jgi:hypothetical protein
MDLNKFRHVATNSCAYFTDILPALIAHIQDSARVYGCIAWLTERNVLNALEKVPCNIIVQQEDWSLPIRQSCLPQYQKLTPVPYTYYQQFKPTLRCVRENYTEKAVRSIGAPEAANTTTALPRMHHKFLIMEKNNGAVGVWTGSFNFTKNATNSLENAVFITDENIVRQYREEFIQLFCLSGELADIWTPERYYSLRTNLIIEPPVLIPVDPIKCNKCGKANHVTEKCWNVICGLCDRIGHDEAACFAKTKLDGTPTKVCTVCDRLGHLGKDCRSKTKADGTPIKPV